MKYSMNFGKPTSGGAPRKAPGRFRIAVLGDFSGRANRGELAKGAELAKRKPIKLDVDNIEDVLQRFGTTLNLPVGAGGSVEFKPASVDDLHPDQLYGNLGIFAELSSLRRRLENPKTAKSAADEVLGWEGADEAVGAAKRRSRASALRVDAKLSDFARLMGAPTVDAPEPTPVDELVQRVVGPFVVAAGNPDQKALVGLVDRALTATMNEVLHHPDFQALEAAWRSLDFLVRRIETDTSLHLVVFDVTAEEFAADLSAAQALDETGLYKLLVEQPALDAQQGPFSLIVANYAFEMTPPHAELLGRAAHLAAAAQAPLIAAIGNDCIDVKLDDLHPLVAEAWDALRALPQAGFLGLALPRFLLRAPYGETGESIDAFDYEEFDRAHGLRGLLWGNPSILAAVLLAGQFRQQGMKMKPGGVLALDDMAYFYFEDDDGEQIAFPCAERLLSEKRAAHVMKQNFIPVLALKGRPEVRLGGFGSLAGPVLLGPWSSPDQLKLPVAGAAAPAATPEPGPAVGGEVEEAAATLPESTSEGELDALLAELEATPAAPAAAESADADLDALLAELEASTNPPPAAEGELDPELAALLADLE
ncbi:MAG: type VI secretion system contractile sheath large subunit [Gammaproteobacteria bacterium]|nr:type VI secretion system contractile sheath large subunit [Gammaproteobacteria bacterium]MBI5615190.1 type VI secretion system contractile sheath large subunit [Gammaproteobacteria bacterium]